MMGVIEAHLATQRKAQPVSFRGMPWQEREEGHRPPSIVAEDGPAEGIRIGKSDIVGHQQPSRSQQSMAFGQGAGVVRFLDVHEDEVESARHPG
jgi:hypothetical protein